MTWDITIPAGDRARNLGDNDLRELQEDLETAFKAHGEFPVTPATPVYAPRGGSGVIGSQPAAADGGFYYDTTNSVMTWSDGSSWRNLDIPSGSKAMFFQAAAPTGWTKDVANNDATVQVVSGSGGGTAGTEALSGGFAHTHASGSYKFRTGEIRRVLLLGTYAGSFYLYDSGGSAFNAFTSTKRQGSGSTNIGESTDPGGTILFYTYTGSGASASDSPVWKYIDCIVCAKD